MTPGLEEVRNNPCALGQGRSGPAILRKHRQSYYSNCSPCELQDRQVVILEGKKGSVRAVKGRENVRGGGARGSPRGGEARAPRGAEGDSARFVALRRRRSANKAGRGRRRAALGGARSLDSILAKICSFSHPSPGSRRKTERVLYLS